MTPPENVQTIHEQISARLRDDVLSGRLQPGTSLREEPLAKRFGISRSPIRQVLQQLTHEGIFESKRNCGVVVAPRPSSEIRSLLLPCRVDIEVYALRSCFERLTEADFAQWKTIVSTMYEAGQHKDVQTVVEQDRLFHSLLVEKAEVPVIFGVWMAISTATHEYHKYFKEKMLPDLCSNYATHAGLLDSFQSGDIETACRVLSDHILNVGSFHRICDQWEKSGKPHNVSGLFDVLFTSK